MSVGKHKAIYNTARWQRVRALKLRETPLCEYCPPDRRKLAEEVDHFKALSDGGAPFDMANLRSACKPCHSQKTAHREHLYGCDENGVPLDPGHPWNARA
jgi:5-methylcytosine-specific restriction endonuclease McrA